MTAVIHPEFKKLFDELEAFQSGPAWAITPWTYEGVEL